MAENLTSRRVETKYVLEAAQAEALLSRLPWAEAASPFERRSGRIATVYFDGEDGVLTRRALASPSSNLKIRVRQYLSTDGLPLSPYVWIEVKEREGRRSRKQRFQLHKRLVGGFLENDLDPAVILSAQGPGVGAPDALEAARRIRQAVNRPLVPVGAVCFHRLSIETGNPLGRLTIDREISYHPAVSRVFGLDSGVGPAAWVDPGTVVEMKHLEGRVSPWGQALLANLEPGEYSKFLRLARLAGKDRLLRFVPQLSHVD